MLAALVLAAATTMPVGRCVRRTAESVLFTCWPPAPDDRYVSTRRSFSSISTSSTSSRNGVTSSARERGLAAVLGVERAHPDQPVHAALRVEQAVGEAALHDERGRQDARLLALGDLVDLDRRSRAAPPSACTCAAASRPSPARRCRPPRAWISAIASRSSCSPREEAPQLEGVEALGERRRSPSASSLAQAVIGRARAARTRPRARAAPRPRRAHATSVSKSSRSEPTRPSSVVTSRAWSGSSQRSGRAASASSSSRRARQLVDPQVLLAPRLSRDRRSKRASAGA